MIFRLRTTKEWTNGANYDAGDANRVKLVRASSAISARRIAAKTARDEGSEAWMDDSTIIDVVRPDGPAGLLGHG